MKDERKKIFRQIVAALLLSVAFGALIPQKGILYRCINGSFCAGMIFFLWGIFRAVRGIGFFDLFLYSHRLLRRYSKKHLRELEENGETEEAPESYHEYLQKKSEAPSPRTPFLIGGAFILISVILILMFL